MNFTWDHHLNAAFVNLSESTERSVVELNESSFAFLDPDGHLAGLELLNTTDFGTPFDHAAAERAVAWAREQLELGTAS
jgi:hypothetical protein